MKKGVIVLVILVFSILLFSLASGDAVDCTYEECTDSTTCNTVDSCIDGYCTTVLNDVDDILRNGPPSKLQKVSIIAGIIKDHFNMMDLCVGEGADDGTGGEGDACVEAWSCTTWDPVDCPDSETQTRDCTCACDATAECTGDNTETQTCTYVADDTGEDAAVNEQVEALLLEAIAHAQAEEYNDALAKIEAAIVLDPDDLTLFLNKGATLNILGDYQGAIGAFTTIIDSSASDDIKYLAYLNRGSAKGALEDYNGAIDDFQSAANLDSTDFMPHYYLGLAYGYDNNIQNSINSYQEAITISKEYETPHAGSYYNYGTTLLLQGNNDDAITQFTEAIGINYQYSRAFYNRGTAYFYKGEYDLAIADFDEAFNLRGDSKSLVAKGIALNVEGNILLEAGNDAGYDSYSEALNAFNLAIATDPDNPEAYHGKGNLYSSVGIYDVMLNGDPYHDPEEDGAIQAYRKAANKDPNNPKYFYSLGLANYNFGELYKDTGLYEGGGYSLVAQANYYYELAIGNYTEAIRLDSNYLGAYKNRGGAYLSSGYYYYDEHMSDSTTATEKYDLAIADYTYIINEITDQDAGTYLSRGQVYNKKGETALEEADNTRYSELSGNPPITYTPSYTSTYSSGSDYSAEIFTSAFYVSGNNAIYTQPTYQW